jgi:hypothetical protein
VKTNVYLPPTLFFLLLSTTRWGTRHTTPHHTLLSFRKRRDEFRGERERERTPNQREDTIRSETRKNVVDLLLLAYCCFSPLRSSSTRFLFLYIPSRLSNPSTLLFPFLPSFLLSIQFNSIHNNRNIVSQNVLVVVHSVISI